MKGEIDAFEKKFGYKPLEVQVAIDALAAFVPEDNPIKGLTLERSTRFSRPRSPGAARDATECGTSRPGCLEGTPNLPTTVATAALPDLPGTSRQYALARRRLQVIGEGTTGFLRRNPGRRRRPLRDRLFGHRLTPLRASAPWPLVNRRMRWPEAAITENCLDGSYPLARFLYIYVNKKPGAPMDKLFALEFLGFVPLQGRPGNRRRGP